MAASMRVSPSCNSPPTRLSADPRIQSKAEVADGWNKLGHDDEKVGASKLRRRLSQMHGDLAEQRVVHAGLLQMPEALHHIFHVAPSLTLAALDDADLRFERK